MILGIVNNTTGERKSKPRAMDMSCGITKTLGTSASELLKQMEGVENVRKTPRHPKRKTQ